MMIVIPVFLIFGISLVAMAIGVVAGRKPIAGSCGGLGHAHEKCGHDLTCIACPVRERGESQ